MRKDPNLHFDGRSYGQLRDRFRLRFPNIYKQQDGTASPAEGMETHVPRPKLQSEKLPKPKKGVLNDSIESVKSDDSDVGAREKTTSKATVAPSSYTAGGLNGEDEDIRLSNSILHNGWDWDDNVTLAPLAWEDIATRPIFGFD